MGPIILRAPASCHVSIMIPTQAPGPADGTRGPEVPAARATRHAVDTGHGGDGTRDARTSPHEGRSAEFSQSIMQAGQ